jgi:hypothetical protein
MLLIQQHLKSLRLHTLPRFDKLTCSKLHGKLTLAPKKKKKKIELEGKITTVSRVASRQEFKTIHRAKNQKTPQSSAKKELSLLLL